MVLIGIKVVAYSRVSLQNILASAPRVLLRKLHNQGCRVLTYPSSERENLRFFHVPSSQINTLELGIKFTLDIIINFSPKKKLLMTISLII